jgi:hypothetical protein
MQNVGHIVRGIIYLTQIAHKLMDLVEQQTIFMVWQKQLEIRSEVRGRKVL